MDFCSLLVICLGTSFSLGSILLLYKNLPRAWKIFRLLSRELSTDYCCLYAEGFSSFFDSWEGDNFSFLVGLETTETIAWSRPIEKNCKSWIALLKSRLALVFMSSTWNLLMAIFAYDYISLLTMLCRTFSISLSVGWFIESYFTKPCCLISWFIFWEKSLFRNYLVCSFGSLNVKMNKGLLTFLVSLTYFSRISLKSAISFGFCFDQILRHSGRLLKI